MTPGTLVEVPIRGKMAPAMVFETESVAEAKQSIKDSSFKMKKVERKIKDNIMDKNFLETAQKAAEYFVATTGSVLSAILPKVFFEEISLKKNEKPLRKETETLKSVASERAHEIFVLQSEREERYAHYKSLIREEFAKDASVFLCLPTIEDVKEVADHIPRGIEKYTFILHSDLSAKELKSAWRASLEEPHSSLIIGTGAFLCLPRRDISTVIVEKESSRSFKMQTRPFIDIRTFAELLCKTGNKRLVLGDTILRTETIARYRDHELPEIAPLKFRFLTTSAQQVVDMRSLQKEKNKEFRVLSEDLVELIRKGKDESENTFIFTSRRGHSSTTSCGDCGTLVTCLSCQTPLVLHKQSAGGRSVFICHKCGEKRGTAEKCGYCGSWKLVPLGVGIERVAEEINEQIPEIKVFRFDSDTANTVKKSQEILKNFTSSPGSVLLGTEKALPYLRSHSLANAAIASFDSLFSLPDFRTNERVLHLLLRVREIPTKKFILQTRMGIQPVLEQGLSGNLLDFYKEEIKEREEFGYPPFSTLIKISLSGKKDAVVSQIKEAEKLLNKWDAVSFPAWNQGEEAKAYTMHALVKIPKKNWIDEELSRKLLSLPPAFSINVDPETLL